MKTNLRSQYEMNFKEIKELIEILDQSSLTEINIEDKGNIVNLKKEKEKKFEDTATYLAVTKLYKAQTGKEPFYAMMPQVVISGPKLSRDYNTNWFATRVNGRYKTCMQKAKNIKI